MVNLRLVCNGRGMTIIDRLNTGMDGLRDEWDEQKPYIGMRGRVLALCAAGAFIAYLCFFCIGGFRQLVYVPMGGLIPWVCVPGHRKWHPMMWNITVALTDKAAGSDVAGGDSHHADDGDAEVDPDDVDKHQAEEAHDGQVPSLRTQGRGWRERKIEMCRVLKTASKSHSHSGIAILLLIIIRKKQYRNNIKQRWLSRWTANN